MIPDTLIEKSVYPDETYNDSGIGKEEEKKKKTLKFLNICHLHGVHLGRSIRQIVMIGVVVSGVGARTQ